MHCHSNMEQNRNLLFLKTPAVCKASMESCLAGTCSGDPPCNFPQFRSPSKLMSPSCSFSVFPTKMSDTRVLCLTHSLFYPQCLVHSRCFVKKKSWAMNVVRLNTRQVSSSTPLVFFVNLPQFESLQIKS